MDTRSSNRPARASPRAWRSWARQGLQVVAVVGVMDLILFGAAGRLDWAGAWVFSGEYLILLFCTVALASRYSPGLMEERAHMAANVKTWDKVVTSIYTLLLLALLVGAGLDAGRFKWTRLPLGLQVSAAVALVPVGAVIVSTTVENAYLSRWARIQEDRGQQVISSGPYRFVRHPMYAAIIPFFICLAVLLRSAWALLPAGMIGVLYVLRTWLEDRMLMRELPGYLEYAARVRYRLIPGLW